MSRVTELQLLQRSSSFRRRRPGESQLSDPEGPKKPNTVYIRVVIKIITPFGSPKFWVPYYVKDLRRDPNFDNHTYGFYTRNRSTGFGNILCTWVLGPVG